ncbi:MAG: hypothetical protein KGL39_47065 [Patescibacteria group bacterium]|nr:hypothetical protein [Patescibacteria group bacterium]
MSEEDNETYTHNANCSNCGVVQGYRIPKDQTIQDFMARQTCRNCGCRMIASETTYKDDHSLRDKGNVLGAAE